MISLHVTKLEKSFGTTAVFSGVSLGHREGSLGIAGSNGSGKSTFLKCLAFLLRPTSGRIAWKEAETVLDRDTVKQRLGYAAPYINLYDELSCRENLEFLADVRHGPEAYRIEEWIKKTGLHRVADQPFGKLSTGQQQRLRIASALFHSPDVLLLDEPGTNLDEAGRTLIADITEDFSAAGKLLVLASNNRGELALCDQVFSIEQESFL